MAAAGPISHWVLVVIGRCCFAKTRYGNWILFRSFLFVVLMKLRKDYFRSLAGCLEQVLCGGKCRLNCGVLGICGGILGGEDGCSASMSWWSLKNRGFGRCSCLGKIEMVRKVKGKGDELKMIPGKY